MILKFIKVINDSGTDSHTSQIIDWLAEYRKLGWYETMWPVFQSLGFTYEQLVVNPVMVRV
jgi:hypothetical protein